MPCRARHLGSPKLFASIDSSSRTSQQLWRSLVNLASPTLTSVAVCPEIEPWWSDTRAVLIAYAHLPTLRRTNSSVIKLVGQAPHRSSPSTFAGRGLDEGVSGERRCRLLAPGRGLEAHPPSLPAPSLPPPSLTEPSYALSAPLLSPSECGASVVPDDCGEARLSAAASCTGLSWPESPESPAPTGAATAAGGACASMASSAGSPICTLTCHSSSRLPAKPISSFV